MLKLKSCKRRSKCFYIALILIILALLNLRIIIKNEIINYRIFSIFLTNAGWYFFSLLVLLIVRIKEFYQSLFNKKNAITNTNLLETYKKVGRMIGGGIVEFYLITVLVILVIGMNIELIDVDFFEQSINMLKLSGISPIREIPLIFIVYTLAYCLLLETVYLSIVIVKTLFINFKYVKTLIFLFFNTISFINLIVIYGIFKNIVYYDLITVIILIVKILFLVILWYILTSFLLGENNFSK